MSLFSIRSRGLDSVEVEAPNWVAALGLGLDGLNRASGLERLACEVLPNGTVIARDIGTGTGFIVQQIDEDDLVELDLAEVEPLDDEHEVDGRSPEEAIQDADSISAACSLSLTLAREMAPCESGAVLLAEKGYLRFVSVVGPASRRLIGVRLPAGTGVAGFAVEHQRVLVLDDAHTDDRHCGDVDALTGYITQHIAVVPILAAPGARCHGVIEVMNPPKGQRFDEDVLGRFKELGQMLARRLDHDR